MIKRIVLGMLILFPIMLNAQQTGAVLAEKKQDITSIPPEKKIDIEKLIDLTGGVTIVSLFTETFVLQIFQAMKDKGKTPSDTVKRVILKEAEKLIEKETGVKGGLRDQLCVVYNKHFTHEDLKKIMAFYTSDIGKKLLKELPLIQQESVEATQTWGQSIGPKIFSTLKKNLLAKGIKLPEI